MYEIYLDIKERLKSEVPEIREVSIYNSQYEYEELYAQLTYPHVLVSFEDGVTFEQSNNGVKSGPAQIKLYIGFESMANEDFAKVFELKSRVCAAIEELTGDTFSGMERVADRYDSDHTNCYVWNSIFNTYYTDTGSWRYRDAVLSGVLTPELETKDFVNKL